MKPPELIVLAYLIEILSSLDAKLCKLNRIDSLATKEALKLKGKLIVLIEAISKSLMTITFPGLIDPS